MHSGWKVNCPYCTIRNVQYEHEVVIGDGEVDAFLQASLPSANESKVESFCVFALWFAERAAGPARGCGRVEHIYTLRAPATPLEPPPPASAPGFRLLPR